MSQKLKINFILPAIQKTGGVLVVLEHARQLRMLGHEVRIYYPLLPYGVYFKNVPQWKRFPIRVKLFFLNLLVAGRQISWSAELRDLHAIPFIADFLILDADVTIATAWPTAYNVASLSASKGVKFYFVQDYEIWHGEKVLVDASYRLPLKILVIAPWLEQLMRVKFARQVTAEIQNGINLDFFRPPSEKPRGHKSILMMYHILESKGISDGLEVLRRLHKVYPEVKIRMFGMYLFPEKAPFIEYFRDPDPGKLLELYQASNIFLCPSLSEGWGLPIVEAMACGCAVVSTRVGCIPILERDGNLLSTEPGNKEALFQHVEFLVNNPAQADQIARKGRESLLNYDWKARSRQFEQVLISSTRTESLVGKKTGN